MKNKEAIKEILSIIDRSTEFIEEKRDIAIETMFDLKEKIADLKHTKSKLERKYGITRADLDNFRYRKTKTRNNESDLTISDYNEINRMGGNNLYPHSIESKLKKLKTIKKYNNFKT